MSLRAGVSQGTTSGVSQGRLTQYAAAKGPLTPSGVSQGRLTPSGASLRTSEAVWYLSESSDAVRVNLITV